VSANDFNSSTVVRPSALPVSRPSYGRFFRIGIVLVVSIIGAAAAVIWMQRNDAIAAYQTATSNLGNGMSQQTSQAIYSVDRVLKEVGAHLTSGPDTTAERIGMDMRTQASRDLLVGMSKGITFATGLAIVDSDGVVRNSSGTWAFTGHDDASQQDFFTHFSVGEDENAFVSVPKKSEMRGEWIAFLSRRINDVHGKFAGIAVAEISLDSIEEFYSGAMPARRSVSLVRRDGTVLVRFPHQEDTIGRKISDHSPWYATVALGGGAYHARDYFTPTQIVAFARPLKNLPLVVQASVTEAEVLANWHLQIGWILLGAAAAVFGVVMLLRYLARQVDLLEQARVLLASKNKELEAANSQLDAALANISLGVSFFSGDKKLIVSNQKYSDIYNLPPEATRRGISLAKVLDCLFTAGSLPDAWRDKFVAARVAMAATGERQTSVVELMNGKTILVTHQPMSDGGWISTHEDITERREADRHIRFLAHHDALTGLSNRAYFVEKLDDAVARLHRHREPFTVLTLDLDKFKDVNDTLGHPAGDQLLQETARRLKSSLRETDVLARLGGDEFAILQCGDENPREGAANLATRILELISEPFDIDGNVVFVGSTIGIALAPENSDISSDLLKMSDLALYAAKASGRNDFCFFEADMLATLDGRREQEDQLRTAISRCEFELHYQALIDVKTGRQAGFEALVRWRSPTRGLVMPDQFIPLAEQTGLIVPLGEWILQQACADAANWPSHIKVAVNLSPVQIAHPDLFQTVQRVLAESSLSAERLELEITETALFKNDTDSVKLIRKLKKLGVSIVLDDFGTGYSSLSYLTMIPFDKIKIDRSFTMNMTKRADCAAIVAAVIALGHSLHAQTVAEGVETEQQLVILRTAGVTLVQGYLFGIPCPASALVLDGVAKKPDDVAKKDSLASAA
jgi:diguanylate cyclase (GGDEF)-like protein